MKKQFLLGLMAMLLPLTSWAQGQASPQPNTFSVTFTGDDADSIKKAEFVYKGVVSVGVDVKYNTLVGGEVKPEDLTPGENGYAVSCTYKVNNDSPSQTITDLTTGIKDAGIYTLTVRGTGVYSSVTPVIKDFTISRKALKLSEDIVKDGVEIPYGTTTEELQTLDVSDYVTLTDENGVVSGDGEAEDALKCLFLGDVVYTGNLVGDAALVEVKALEENLSTNYKYEQTGKVFIRINVGKRLLTLAIADDYKDGHVYDGAKIEVTDLLEALNFTESDKEEGKVGYEPSMMKDGKVATGIKDAGNYAITVNLIGEAKNYYKFDNNTTTSTINYEVTRKNITIEKAVDKLEKVYDGEPVSDELLEESFDIDGIVNNEITISMKPSNATKGLKDAGSKVLIMPYVGTRMLLPTELGDDKKPTGDGLDNYTITYSPTNFSINKRYVKYYFAGGSKDYDGQAVTDPVAEPTVIAEDGTGFVPDSGDDFDNKPKAKFAASVTEAKNAGHYPLVEDTENEVTFKDGSENYTAVFVGDYTLPETAEATEDAEPVNVNEYVINKAQFTIRALGHEVKFTTAEGVEALMAELTEYLKITTGKIGYEGGNLDGKNIVRTSVSGGEVTAANAIVTELGNTLKIAEEDIDLTKVGVYTITFLKNSIDHDNYDVNLIDGKLTIKGNDKITFNGDAEENEVAELLRIYNGATVETVEVTNLMNYVGVQGNMLEPTTRFEANKWYMLTLPFEITVRELSQQLEYAVVNIPDIVKTGANGAYFTLEVQKVPANTLMIFKVDEDREISTLSFGNKKIVAPNNEMDNCNVETIKGVDFVSVYAKKHIDGMDEWYLWPSGGGFYQAYWGLTEENDGNGIDVYPLNGYIHFQNTTNARIYVEDTDGTVTAINAVTGEAINNNAEGWYTVGGVKLNAQPTQKGIYINNGKKVVIK